MDAQRSLEEKLSKDSGGAELREKRRIAGITLSRIALRLGVHCVTVSEWERGTSRPTAEQAEILDRLFAGDPDE